MVTGWCEMDPLERADPRRIGDYTLEGRLGAGGMGAVYLGRSPGGHRVAVKVIHPQHVRDPEFRARFRREVVAAQRVRSPFTAQVVAADPDAPTPWIATRYIEGPSLWRKVNQDGPLSAREVAEVAAGTAEALAAIHAAEVVHRDLKPENILLAADGPYIIDFGIARAADASVLTASGTVLGTPAFMSPEQFLGRDVAASTDIFSLGGVIYFAATARLAFGSGEPWAVMRRILDEPPDLHSLRHNWLRELIAKCLAKEPSDRPTPSQILLLCADILDGAGDLGGTPSPTRREQIEQDIPSSIVAQNGITYDPTPPSPARSLGGGRISEAVRPAREAHAVMPLFDGLYEESSDRSFSTYFRFTSSGDVYSASSQSNAAIQVARWLGPGHSRAFSGKYKLRGQEISFTTSGKKGAIAYDGQISSDGARLNLNIHSHINGRRRKAEYIFVAILTMAVQP